MSTGTQHPGHLGEHQPRGIAVEDLMGGDHVETAGVEGQRLGLGGDRGDARHLRQAAHQPGLLVDREHVMPGAQEGARQ
ncbi:Uncharacterised protein [Mycobacteroides abscessus subsp. abscessus]|nr:Uncharacterised protein [Mycobacteroides abscessus subsp. abscessus]